MIIYRYDPSIRRSDANVPPWLEGWESDAPGIGVCSRETEDGTIYGVADPLLFNLPARRAWEPLGDNWQAIMVGTLDPRPLARGQRWADTRPVVDMQGRTWLAPRILGEDGTRAFRVAYGGPDFLPTPTPIQLRCFDVAQAARAEVEGGGLSDIGISARWASILLASVMHIPEAAFSVFSLPDEFLIIGTLQHGTGLPLKLATPPADQG